MLQENSTKQGPWVERYILENISELFPQHHVVAIHEHLPGGRSIDLHLKDKKGNDLFIEVKGTKIDKKYLGQILDYYSAISNYNPKARNKSKLIVIGQKIDPVLRKELEDLNISFISLDKLGFSYAKMLEEERNRRLRTLTPTEAALVLDWEAHKIQTVTTNMLIKKLGHSKNYANKLLRKLEGKKWLSRILPGVYSFIPAEYGYEERFPRMNPFLIGSALITPYYFSYSTANSHYGFTAQLPATYYIATTKKRAAFGWRNIRFQFITLSRKKFFGFTQAEKFGATINMAEPEKALIDAVDKMKYCGGTEEVVRVIQRGLNTVNKRKLVDYALRIDSYVISQRLGFIIDFLCEERLAKFPSRLKNRLLQNVGKTVIYLDASRTKRGRYVKEWNIIQNVSEKELLSELEIR